MNILITGSNGYIGNKLGIFLKKKKISVYGIGNKSRIKKQEKHLKIYKKNIVGKVNKFNINKFSLNFDYIIHCAGSGKIGLKKDIDYKKNVLTTINLLNYVSKFSPRSKIILLSSASVYGNNSKKFSEKTKLQPISNYAANKIKSENLCKKFNKKKNLNITILRITSIYGNGIKKQFIFDACNKINKNMNIFFGTGKEIRDFLHINDFNILIYKIIKKNITGLNIYNCGSGKGYKIKKVLKIIISLFKSQIIPKFNNSKLKQNPKTNVISIKNLKKLGWAPKKKFEDGIKEYVSWYKKNY